MKKSLILAGIIALMATSTASYAATEQTATVPTKQPVCEKKKAPEMRKAKRPERPNLDERLKLTEEQKTKAHELRMAGHEKIKPVMEKIKTKHEEIKKILDDTALTQEQKDKKIYAVEKEILDLKQQARKIRTENMKKFEALLTDEQKAELEKIKQEGREMRAKAHKGPQGPHGHHGPAPLAPEFPNK